jgi:hypothetical protein
MWPFCMSVCHTVAPTVRSHMLRTAGWVRSVRGRADRVFFFAEFCRSRTCNHFNLFFDSGAYVSYTVRAAHGATAHEAGRNLPSVGTRISLRAKHSTRPTVRPITKCFRFFRPVLPLPGIRLIILFGTHSPQSSRLNLTTVLLYVHCTILDDWSRYVKTRGASVASDISF